MQSVPEKWSLPMLIDDYLNRVASLSLFDHRSIHTSDVLHFLIDKINAVIVPPPDETDNDFSLVIHRRRIRKIHRHRFEHLDRRKKSVHRPWLTSVEIVRDSVH